MADNNVEPTLPGPLESFLRFLERIPFVGPLLASLDSGVRGVIVWAMVSVFALVMLIVMLSILGGTLNHQKVASAPSDTTARIENEKKIEAATRLPPLEIGDLYLPPMLDRLKNGEYRPVFPPKARWTLEEWVQYVPNLKDLYVKALERKNDKDFEKLLDSIEPPPKPVR